MSNKMLMGNIMYPRFINGNEGREVFYGMSPFKTETHPFCNNVKIWLGSYLGVYKYLDDQINPVIVDKLKMVNLEVKRTGPSGLLISMLTGTVTEVTCIPKLLADTNIVVRFPQRTFFERTIVEHSKGDYSLGLAACIITACKGKEGEPNIDLLETWGNLRNKFTDSFAFSREVEALKGRSKI